MAEQQVCTSCGTVGLSKRVTRGSIVIEIFLWVLFCFPGLIYSIWRLSTRHNACARCGGQALVPISSPMGQKIYRDMLARGP